MSREKPQEFTMPCLGRPFQLGMLYDCRSDQLISSVTLWNQETLKQSHDSNPQKFSSFEIIADNSTESKLSKLGVDENLKLSFLAGLVDVSGAAAYLNDQTSSEKQVRINLRYQSTAWIEQLSIGKLGDLVNPDVFKETTATHFVSAILYGADAIIVFDQEVSHDEIPHSHGFMKSMVEKLPTICTSGNSALDISDTDKRKVQKFQCKVYCDLPLPEIPSTFEGVVNLCKDLPTLLGESDSPQKVWLYPLSKLNSKVEPIMRKISVGLVTQTQDFMGATHELEMKTTDLMNSEVCTSFVAIKKQLSCFKRRIAEYKVDFASNLATLIPKIRGGVEEEDELNKLFTGKDASPFSHVCLLSWVEGKMSEVKVLENYLSYMEGFKFAFLPGDMDSVVGDPEYNLVISFTFTAAGQCDPYLEGMTAYLQPHATGQDVKNLPISWYNNSKIISNMKARTRLFKSFAKANEQVKDTKFVVTSSIDELSEEGAVIELYEDCNKEIFEPPSKPGKPSATSVTHSSIQVNWSKPKSGAKNVQFYNVHYCELSCSPEQWKAEKTSGSKESITVTNLGPQKKYCFKVQAECKAGLSEVSEVSEPIHTDLVSVAPGKPTVSSKSHNSIQLQWSKAQYGEHNVDFYTISCHETKDSRSPELESHCKTVKTEGTEQSATVSNLVPKTAYCFKVHADFRTGKSLVSEISDPILTFSVPVPPDKPIASKVTHNRIQLKWSEPQYGGQSVECYTVFYCESKDAPDLQQWKKVTLDNTKQTVTVDNLTAQTKYSFRVQAQFKGGPISSDVSDPISTNPHPRPPGKPIASNVTHNSVYLEWSEPQYGGESVEFYTVLYCDSNNLQTQWKELRLDSPKQPVKVDNLAPQTKYSFRVRATFKAGLYIDSEDSHPVQTCPLPVKPGKPTVSKVTHDSIQLKWSKAQCGTQNVSYTVFYDELGQTKEIEAHTSSVTVSNLTPQTEYKFKVNAKFRNDMKLFSDTSDVIKTYPLPEPPGKPIASTVTHSPLELKWSKSHYGGEKAESYTVFFFKPGHQPEQWKELDDSHTCRESVTVHTLHPKVQYCFKVRANFKAGIVLESETSDPIQASPPSVPPGEPTASKVTHNSVHLKWTEARYGEHRVQHYTVMYHTTKDLLPQQQWNKQETRNTSINIAHLVPQTAYRFVVYVKFETDYSLNSTYSDIQTDRYPQYPGKPDVSDITHDSAQLKWSPAYYRGEEVEYTVLSSDVSTQQPQKETKTLDTFVTVSELASETKYSFQVHAKFKGGKTFDSDPSDPILTKPFPVHPGKPDVFNNIITHNSIHLKWTKASYGKHKVDSYTVSLCEISDPSQNLWREIKSPKTSVVVTGLTPETEYRFKVNAEIKAACKHGITLTSTLSDPIQTCPLPVPPARPIACSKTHNSVQLKWSKAHYGEHNIDHYTVYFCKASNRQTQELLGNIEAFDTSAAVSGLTAETRYSFKVVAEFKGGITVSGEFSDPIQTNPSPRKPGKPTVYIVTHNTVQVEWSAAQCGKQKLQLYHIFYNKIEGSKEAEQWMEYNISTGTNTTIGGLNPQSVYSFKVQAKFEDSTILESEISDPIQTPSPPVPPGKPFASSRTHHSVQLEWVVPDCEVQMATFYTVSYCSKSKSKNKKPWKEVGSRIRKESVLVCDLTPATEYLFQVCAVFNFGTLNSEISDPISTYPASVIPGKPFAFSVTHNSIELQWPRPDYGAEYVRCYCVLWREAKGQWKERKSRGAIESITVSGLGAKKEYCFKIRAETITSCGLTNGTSETSDPIKTKTRIALQMFSKHPTKEGPLEVHKLSMVEQMTDKTNRIKKCVIGKHPPCIPSQQKVLLVVGATGAGKTTLINGMINYILKVEWTDRFRFKLITEEEQQTQAKSQTKWITAYTLPKMEGSPVPYTLTVIDTPGFGDTAGLERDKAITKQIKEFFSTRSPNGIDHIDGIGFVTQSALARLTPTQRYIFNAILAIFGKDVADNIFMMVTFADGQTPPVMAAIKDAALPYKKFYKFNNSALFASNHVEADAGDPEADNFDRMFWEMGTVSFKDFFIDFSNATPTSLQLTREVLDERERLETTISGLHPQIRRGLAKIEEMRQEEEVLKEHEAEIATNKDFTYAVDITKQRKVDLQGQGIHVTNCLRCNFTCHPNCRIPKDEDKHLCSAMDRMSGFCTVCTKKCKWDQHVNNPYRYEEYVVQEQRTLDDLKKKYDEAVAGKTQKESMLIGIDNQLKGVHTEVLTMIKQVQKCLQRLDEIALKPNPLTEVDFLDLLIESEKQQAEPGWLSRVRYYESAKQQAEMLQHLQAEDVVAALDTEPENSQYMSWYARFKYWIGFS